MKNNVKYMVLAITLISLQPLLIYSMEQENQEQQKKESEEKSRVPSLLEQTRQAVARKYIGNKTAFTIKDYESLPAMPIERKEELKEAIFKQLNKKYLDVDQLDAFLSTVTSISNDFANFLAQKIEDGVFDINYERLLYILNEHAFKINVIPLRDALLNNLERHEKWLSVVLHENKNNIKNLSFDYLIALTLSRKLALTIYQELKNRAAIISSAKSTRYIPFNEFLEQFSINVDMKAKIQNTLFELEKLINQLKITDGITNNIRSALVGYFSRLNNHMSLLTKHAITGFYVEELED